LEDGLQLSEPGRHREQLREAGAEVKDPNSQGQADQPPGTYICSQCCGFGMFIPDPNFFYSRIRIFSIPDRKSASKNLSIFTQKQLLLFTQNQLLPDDG
jgi:hypothetical protein